MRKLDKKAIASAITILTLTPALIYTLHRISLAQQLAATSNYIAKWNTLMLILFTLIMIAIGYLQNKLNK